MTLTKTPSRVATLDSLRGLASLAVVFSHVAAITWVPWDTAHPPTWAVPLWHLGAPAVDVFFVLSGFVLAGAWQRRPDWASFLTRRWWRLAPLAYVGVLAGLLNRHLALGLPEGLSTLVDHQLRQPLRLVDAAQLATLLTPSGDVDRSNPPLWTLMIEMHMALVLPLMVGSLTRGGWARLLPWTVAGALLWVVNLSSGMYVPMFAVGVLLAVRPPALPDRIRGVPVLGACLAVGTLILLQRHVTGNDSEWARYLTLPGAALVVLSVSRGAARRALSVPALRALGRVSFPLYLCHFPLLLLGVRALPAHPALGALLGVPLSLLAAWALERSAERPLLAWLASTQTPPLQT